MNDELGKGKKLFSLDDARDKKNKNEAKAYEARLGPRDPDTIDLRDRRDPEERRREHLDIKAGDMLDALRRESARGRLVAPKTSGMDFQHADAAIENSNATAWLQDPSRFAAAAETYFKETDTWAAGIVDEKSAKKDVAERYAHTSLTTSELVSLSITNLAIATLSPIEKRSFADIHESIRKDLESMPTGAIVSLIHRYLRRELELKATYLLALVDCYRQRRALSTQD